MAQLTIAGCGSIGPTRVEPEGDLAGLAHLLEGDDPRPVLNILLIHGMGVHEPEPYKDLVPKLVVGLGFKGVEPEVGEPVVLETTVPDVRIGGQALWPTQEAWRGVAPTLTIEKYRSTDGRRVNLYMLEYWRALGAIKCRGIVETDSRLIGRSKIAEACDRNRVGEPLAARPAIVNRALKSRLVEWGFSDAIIAVSPFRDVLRKTVHAAMNVEADDALSASIAGLTSMSTEQVLARLQTDHANERFAVVTHSLGSFLFFDALQAPPPQAATRAIYCSTRQIHMLANQVPLLALADLLREEEPSVVARASDEFERCPNRPEIQTVAYHEPNDPLTFFIRDQKVARRPITNVVLSYARQWFRTIVADPNHAHTGQAGKRALIEILVNGRVDD